MRNSLLSIALILFPFAAATAQLPAPGSNYPPWTESGEICSNTAIGDQTGCGSSDVQTNNLWSATPWVNFNPPGSTCCNCLTSGIETGGPVACATYSTANPYGGYLPFLTLSGALTSTNAWNWVPPAYSIPSGCDRVFSAYSSSWPDVAVAATHQYGAFDVTFYYLLQIPNDANLIGLHVTTQWGRLDPTDSAFRLSRAVEFIVLP